MKNSRFFFRLSDGKFKDQHGEANLKTFAIMLTTKILKTTEELNRFITMQLENGGAEVTLDYLQQAEVRVTYRKSNPDIWMGGYVISIHQKRYLDVLPQDTRQAIEDKYLPPNKTAEISCIWKNRAPHQKPQGFEVAQLYWFALQDGMLTGRPILLGGTAHEKIRRIQMIVFRHLAFSGEVNFYGTSHHVWIYYCTRLEVLPGFVNYVRMFLF